MVPGLNGGFVLLFVHGTERQWDAEVSFIWVKRW